MKSPFKQEYYDDLMKQYESADNPGSRHFARQDLAAYCYKYREDPEMLDRCIALCEEDIRELPILDEYASVGTAMKCKTLGYKPTPGTMDYETIKHGFTGRIVTLERLAIIEKDRGHYNRAKALYQQCLARIAWNDRAKDEIARLERAIAAVDKKIAAQK
mgnify:FL=1|nr:MAG TPA: hypothetical protein [Caudoviricetes sp.]